MSYPPKVQAAIDAGELWRAREILGSYVTQRPFDPELCEQYGKVLLQLGDKVNAGRYLFLSGSRDPSYADAVDIFLKRFGRHGWHQLLGVLPGRVRRLSPSELPQPVVSKLVELGMPPDFRPEVALETLTDPSPRELGLFVFGCGLTGMLAVLLMVLGALELVDLVSDFLSSFLAGD